MPEISLRYLIIGVHHLNQPPPMLSNLLTLYLIYGKNHVTIISEKGLIASMLNYPLYIQHLFANVTKKTKEQSSLA